MATRFNELPEILLELVPFLSNKDRSSCALVCHAWYTIFAPSIWSEVHLGLYGRSQYLSMNDVRKKAPWIRSLTYHRHGSLDQFMLGEGCSNLRSLAILEDLPYTDDYDDGYRESCMDLMERNQGILQHLTLENSELPPRGGSVPRTWRPLLSMRSEGYVSLRSLALTNITLQGEQTQAFYDIAARLEVLKLLHVVPDTDSKASMEPTWSWHARNLQLDRELEADLLWHPVDAECARFPRLREMTITNMLKVSSKCQLANFIRHAPRLRLLEWALKHERLPMHEFLGLLHGTRPQGEHELGPASSLSWTTSSTSAWPDLESLTIKTSDYDDWNLMKDEEYLGILRSKHHGFQKLDVGRRYFTDPAIELLLRNHGQTLCEVDFLGIHDGETRKWTQRVLETCPCLERIRSKAIHVSNIEQGQGPWVCTRLREFVMLVDMNPQGYIPARVLNKKEQEQECRVVFEQLARLKNLRLLDMRERTLFRINPTEGRMGDMTARMATPVNAIVPQLSTLPLNVEMGLDLLSGLTKLEKVYYQWDQELCRKDVLWIIKHWKSLEILHGRTLATRKVAFARDKNVWDIELSRFLNAHGIETPGSRYTSASVSEGYREQLDALMDEDGNELELQGAVYSEPEEHWQ